MLYVKFITGCLAAALLLGSCTKETEQKGTDPVTPETDNARREVMMTLKNKLAVTPVSTKAGTPIATAAENAISTLDVYVFGATQENGDYTFLERFAYRADANDKLPQGATELQLNTTDAEGKETTGLLKLKRGLFVKLYCIANDTTLVDPATAKEIKPADFTPITFTENEDGNPQLATEGTPLESTFTTWHTRLLAANAEADTLVTPLAMAGAYTTPVDLTAFDNAARIQVGFRLTRLAARFDIDNKAGISRFTIETVSMGNGRRGSGFFPIRVYGDLPEAKADQLITYPVHALYGENANNGTQTGAFYAYPSSKEDKAYLILKGKYKVNETEMKDVSYQIPFMQQTADGNTVWFDIANNHRYTVAIKKADTYHLDANIQVADWADDGNIEYTPDNGNREFEFDIPASFEGETVYDKETRTVSMSLKDDSEFDLTVGTTSLLTLQKTYVGGLAAQQYDWLEIEEAPTKRQSKAALTGYVYTFRRKADYDKTLFPRAVIRFTNGMDGSETVLFVEPVIAAPQIMATEQEINNHNTLDAETRTVSLYRVLDSHAKVKVTCPHGISIVDQPEWLDVTTVEAAASFSLFRFALKNKDRDIEIAENKGTVTFQNAQDPTAQTVLTINLKDASVEADFATLGGTENTYDEPVDLTPGNVNMKLLKDNTFTISVTSLDGVEVETDFNGGPEWFTHDGDVFTKAGNKTQSILFTLDANALSTGKALKTNVTLHNISKGMDYSFTVTPFGYEIVNVKQTSSTGNNLIGETINMVKMSSNAAYHATITLQVTSPGGSNISITGTGLTIDKTSSTDYTASYTIDAASNAAESGTLTITNYQDITKNKEYSITVKDQTVTYTSKSTGQTAPALEMTSYWVAPVTEGLANFSDAQSKCPDGWRLPQNIDFCSFVINDLINTQNLFLTGGDPAGKADYTDGYWSSNSAPDGNGNKAQCIENHNSCFTSYRANTRKRGWTVQRSHLLNVRCIKNK